MSKRLVAGPWLGEFGWEIMSWQGFIRKAAVGYDEVFVCSREGHEALYADFSTRFIPHRVAGLKDRWSVSGVDAQSLKNLKAYLRTLGGDQLQPTGLIPIEHQHITPCGSKERGKRLGYNFDMVIHARKPIGKRPGHAWPLSHWNQLVAKLSRYRIASIGTEAYVPEGTVDMRGCGLLDTMDAMAATKVVIGPSSGPMHLAALCRVPHVVWTDTQVYSAIGATNRERYETLWNPLKTPVTVVDTAGWHPTADAVYAAVLERLEQWNKKPSNP